MKRRFWRRSVGWYESILPEERMRACDYLCDHYTPDDKLHKAFISLAMRSRCDLCIIPMQDYLGLDNTARMNKPSTVGDNWRWRLTETEMTDALQEEIRHMTKIYGRM